MTVDNAVGVAAAGCRRLLKTNPQSAIVKTLDLGLASLAAEAIDMALADTAAGDEEEQSPARLTMAGTITDPSLKVELNGETIKTEDNARGTSWLRSERETS